MMVPFYLGLLFTLVLLFGVFVRELLKYLPDMWTMDANTAILATLTLIDLALVGNLVVIVVLASYETMVSKIDTDAERPGWMGSLGFADVKQKLFTSIVAISGIHLLKLFMSVGGSNPPEERTMFWLTVGFSVASGVLGYWMSTQMSLSVGTVKNVQFGPSGVIVVSSINSCAMARTLANWAFVISCSVNQNGGTSFPMLSRE